MSSTSVTPYFVFTQTVKRFEYIWHVFQQLKYYCGGIPKSHTSYRNNIPSTSCQIHTRSYSFLIPLFQLFYKKDLNGKWKKVITSDLLPYLDDISLSY